MRLLQQKMKKSIAPVCILRTERAEDFLFIKDTTERFISSYKIICQTILPQDQSTLYMLYK